MSRNRGFGFLKNLGLGSSREGTLPSELDLSIHWANIIISEIIMKATDQKTLRKLLIKKFGVDHTKLIDDTLERHKDLYSSCPNERLLSEFSKILKAEKKAN